MTLGYTINFFSNEQVEWLKANLGGQWVYKNLWCWLFQDFHSRYLLHSAQILLLVIVAVIMSVRYLPYFKCSLIWGSSGRL